MKPVVLCILDGVGVSKFRKNNAVLKAKTPFYNELAKKYPSMLIRTDGEYVGLPPKTMGNSEVGHITIGSGRIVNQYLRRFQLENLSENKPLKKFIESATSGIVHFVGLSSDGRVHADINDALKVAKIVVKSGKKIIWHFISDGRDVNANTAPGYVKLIKKTLGSDCVFGSLGGRYFGMDRNDNWDRSEKSFDTIIGKGPIFKGSIEQAIKLSYENGKTDEFIEPVRFPEYMEGLKKDDGVLFFNYRADRARQFLKLLVKFGHKKILCFSQYGDGLDEHCPSLLPEREIKNTFGDVLEKNGISQLRLAETEKYNHVTYFMDAERMIDYKDEKKILVPSPNVATFDLKPEMSAPEITDEFLKHINEYRAVIMNYANGDMVGHTGKLEPAIKAVETLDVCLQKIVPAVIELGGTILIMADHGNAEKMADWRGRPWTAHTTNPVRLIMVSADQNLKLKKIKGAGLSNLAPTMLKILDIKIPKEMTEPLV